MVSDVCTGPAGACSVVVDVDTAAVCTGRWGYWQIEPELARGSIDQSELTVYRSVGGYWGEWQRGECPKEAERVQEYGNGIVSAVTWVK